MHLDGIVLTYMSAWSETDDGERRALLEKCWNENGMYTDPTGDFIGREALCQHIGAFLRRYTGHHFLLASGVNQHHGWLRFGWVLIRPDGSKLMEGCDFGAVDANGRLQSIRGFFGPLPAVASAWPEELVSKN
ncbi:MAG TPA: hypothetical protein VFN23_12200 [Ktedonobacteraceae bacterium]|nr:hypothetical protein [Ktedonobacteraceae bacterium]